MFCDLRLRERALSHFDQLFFSLHQHFYSSLLPVKEVVWKKPRLITHLQCNYSTIVYMQGVFLVVECKHNPPTNCVRTSIMCFLNFHDTLIVTKKRKPRQIKGLLYNFTFKVAGNSFLQFSVLRMSFTNQYHQTVPNRREGEAVA